MKELAGRLSALDPEASETLKVISYFDKLVDGRVGHEGMLRGAAVLSGATIGFRRSGQVFGKRFAANGAELEAASPEGWAGKSAGEGSLVWLERNSAPHANDAMVLERLALALSITTMRLDTMAPTRRAIEVLVSGGATPEELQEAAARLSIAGATYAIAMPLSVRLTAPHAVVATRFGVVRAVLSPTDHTSAPRAGIGTAASSARTIHESWRSALVALRLSDSETPVLRAADLGALLTLAANPDAELHPDAHTIAALSNGPWDQALLGMLAAGASQRTLAVAAGVHHSTMGMRLEKLPAALGYNPMTPTGRTRLNVALMLHRLATVRFEDGNGQAAPHHLPAP